MLAGTFFHTAGLGLGLEDSGLDLHLDLTVAGLVTSLPQAQDTQKDSH